MKSNPFYFTSSHDFSTKLDETTKTIIQAIDVRHKQITERLEQVELTLGLAATKEADDSASERRPHLDVTLHMFEFIQNVLNNLPYSAENRATAEDLVCQADKLRSTYDDDMRNAMYAAVEIKKKARNVVDDLLEKYEAVSAE